MRRLLALAWCCWVTPAWAMTGLLTGTTSTTDLDTAAARYQGLTGNSGSATETVVSMVMPTGGTFDALQVTLATAPNNGAGTQQYDITLRQNAGNTTLTCAIAEAATTCSDTTHFPTVAAGDLVDLVFTPSASAPIGSKAIWTLRFTSNTTNVPNRDSVILGGGNTACGAFGTAATEDTHAPSMGCHGNADDDPDLAVVIPTPGQIKNLYVASDTAPDTGAGTQSAAVTVYLNNAAQTMTCSYSEAAKTCNDLTASRWFAVVAGDKVRFQYAPTNTPAAANKIAMSVVFEATQDGEFIWGLASDNNLLANNTTYYQFAQGAENPENTTETVLNELTQVALVRGIRCLVRTAPNNGAGTQTRTWQFREAAANQGPACTMSEAETTGSGATTYTMTNAAVVDTSLAGANTPAAPGSVNLAYWMYLAPRRRIR